MSTRKTHAVEYGFWDSEPTSGEVDIDEFSIGERVLRVVGALAIGWGLAVVAVFIPVAHFFLVPIFLAGGVWYGVRRFRQRNALVGARGKCPKCGVEDRFRVDGEFRAGKKVVCGECWGDVALG